MFAYIIPRKLYNKLQLSSAEFFFKKMLNFHLNIFIFCSVFALVFGFSEKLKTLTFDEGYSHLFGHDNLMVLEDGKSVHISLDKRTGLYFIYLSSNS